MDCFNVMCNEQGRKWTAVAFVMRKDSWKTGANMLWNVNGVWISAEEVLHSKYKWKW
jgi:hypothetical protein